MNFARTFEKKHLARTNTILKGPWASIGVNPKATYAIPAPSNSTSKYFMGSNILSKS